MPRRDTWAVLPANSEEYVYSDTDADNDEDSMISGRGRQDRKEILSKKKIGHR